MSKNYTGVTEGQPIVVSTVRSLDKTMQGIFDTLEAQANTQQEMAEILSQLSKMVANLSEMTDTRLPPRPWKDWANGIIGSD
jgi:hypothetical protein